MTRRFGCGGCFTAFAAQTDQQCDHRSDIQQDDARYNNAFCGVHGASLAKLSSSNGRSEADSNALRRFAANAQAHSPINIANKTPAASPRTISTVACNSVLISATPWMRRRGP